MQVKITGCKTCADWPVLDNFSANDVMFYRVISLIILMDCPWPVAIVYAFLIQKYYSFSDDVFVSSLHFIKQIGSLAVGFNFGCFQLWDLSRMNLE